MNNDPNNMNNNMNPNGMNNGVNPTQPVMNNNVAPAPVVPEQPAQPQMGANPHQHVDMNSLTPRTVFDTSVEPKKEEPPKVEEKATAPKEKSSAVPLLMILLLIGFGGYFVYSQFFASKDTNENIVINDNKEEEEKDEKEETEEGKEKTEEQKPAETTETPAAESTPAAEQPAATPAPAETPATAEPSTPSGGEKEFIQGEVLYLYFDGGIGSDGVMFRYVSHSSSEIVVNVEIDGNTKKYTITPGKQTKIDHIKNPIVMTIEEEYIAINFK